MKVVITLDLPEKLYEQLKQAASEQPHLDGIEDLAIACLEDAMEEREELLGSLEETPQGEGRSATPALEEFECELCLGTGNLNDETCSECEGTGVYWGHPDRGIFLDAEGLPLTGSDAVSLIGESDATA